MRKIPLKPDHDFFKDLSYWDKSIILLSYFSSRELELFLRKVHPEKSKEITDALSTYKNPPPHWIVKWSMEDYLSNPVRFNVFDLDIYWGAFPEAA